MTPRRLPPLSAAWGERLRGATGPAYWRSLEEYARTPEFTAWARDEFPAEALEIRDGGMARREFLKLMGASFALMGITACGRGTPEAIVPYVRQPEQAPPGVPVFYATTLTRGGYGLGVVVETHEGRPTKVEGNPAHPASLGRTDIFAQADVLGLYDPDRSAAPRGPDGPSTWGIVSAELDARARAWRARRGHGLRLLTGHLTSPTILGAIGTLLGDLPEASWHVHEPFGLEPARAGLRLATGRTLEPVLDVARAAVVVTLDADILGAWPGNVRHARGLIEGRRAGRSGEPNRLYAAEASFTLTGANADHRLAARPSQIEPLAAALAARLGLPQAPPAPDLPADATRWVASAAADLRRHAGAGLVVAGLTTPPHVHALAWALNQHLGNLGTTLTLRDADAAAAGLTPADLPSLTAAMAAGEVTDLLVIECNPAYTAPAAASFAAALARVPFSLHLGVYHDETAAACAWHVPARHPLEDWGDARADDGTASLIQPLSAPGPQPRSTLELLAMLNGTPLLRPQDMVQAHWRAHAGAADFATWWRQALHDGVASGTRPAPVSAAVDVAAVRAAWDRATAPPARGLELAITPDPTIWDGRYANLGWLQELPKPLTSLTWSNALLIAPATAQTLGVGNGDVVRITRDDRALDAPVWVVPGQHEECVTLSLGYGRRAGGRLAVDLGVDPAPLRDDGAPWAIADVSLTRTGARVAFAATQLHQVMEGRDLVRAGTFAAPPSAEPGGEPHHDSLYPDVAYAGQQWGMVIDLTACIGCGVCTIACQAENNIPVVGADQVRKGREMHWIRVDRYFRGAPARPDVVFQPLPCMHCELAPCEPVCPVGATQHSHDGLNEMVYNRCIGTRYCSNNCPYKVRRFNFLQYVAPDLQALAPLRNPDVTVRGRGVMEKCTYCVQRLRQADITARKENRAIRDGEVVTACQGACPTDAIVFGDINDPASRVARARRDPQRYELLAELNTRPRTSYLPALRNPDPDLQAEDLG